MASSSSHPGVWTSRYLGCFSSSPRWNTTSRHTTSMHRHPPAVHGSDLGHRATATAAHAHVRGCRWRRSNPSNCPATQEEDCLIPQGRSLNAARRIHAEETRDRPSSRLSLSPRAVGTPAAAAAAATAAGSNIIIWPLTPAAAAAVAHLLQSTGVFVVCIATAAFLILAGIPAMWSMARTAAR